MWETRHIPFISFGAPNDVVSASLDIWGRRTTEESSSTATNNKFFVVVGGVPASRREGGKEGQVPQALVTLQSGGFKLIEQKADTLVLIAMVENLKISDSDCAMNFFH